MKHDLRPKLMAQPPWDKGLGEFFILHFTYGNDYDENGVFTPGKVGKWRFDKRSYMAGIPPKNLDPPPAGCDNELVKRLIEMMNEASATLPNWEDPLGAGRGAGRRMLRAGWLDTFRPSAPSAVDRRRLQFTPALSFSAFTRATLESYASMIHYVMTSDASLLRYLATSTSRTRARWVSCTCCRSPSCDPSSSGRRPRLDCGADGATDGFVFILHDVDRGCVGAGREEV